LKNSCSSPKEKDSNWTITSFKVGIDISI